MRRKTTAPDFDLGSHLEAMLKKIPLPALARQTGWMQRASQKITPLNLVTAALLLVSQPQISLTVLAVLLGWLCRNPVSKQAVDERLTATAALFLKESLGAALSVGLASGQAAKAKLRQVAGRFPAPNRPAEVAATEFAF
ncbi:MAG: hypothetical protein MUF81_16175 [Verrucomicrobia bacterium]|nr:hypothetical protein [Verrucomicrobiota bacterium]